MRPVLLAGLATLGLALVASPALAQDQEVPDLPAERPRAAPPPSGPTGSGPGATRARQPRAGTPTDQLFDAINEGEIADVRAAVAAGADIGARNMLGLTPVDLAIDLGRNDVALYLLSLGRVRERPLAPLPQEAQPRAPRQTPQQQRNERAAIEAALRERAPSVSGQGIVAVAPLWRGGGGEPNPAIGFLGFDAGRPPGATPPRQASAPPRAAPTRAAAPTRPAAPRSPVTREPLPPG